MSVSSFYQPPTVVPTEEISKSEDVPIKAECNIFGFLLAILALVFHVAVLVPLFLPLTLIIISSEGRSVIFSSPYYLIFSQILMVISYAAMAYFNLRSLTNPEVSVTLQKFKITWPLIITPLVNFVYLVCLVAANLKGASERDAAPVYFFSILIFIGCLMVAGLYYCTFLLFSEELDPESCLIFWKPYSVSNRRSAYNNRDYN